MDSGAFEAEACHFIPSRVLHNGCPKDMHYGVPGRVMSLIYGFKYFLIHFMFLIFLNATAVNVLSVLTFGTTCGS